MGIAENRAQSLVGRQVGPYKIDSLLGVGGMGILRWRPGWQPGKVGWSLGAVCSLALDFLDPLRSNDLRLGAVVRLGAVLGVDLP